MNGKIQHQQILAHIVLSRNLLQIFRGMTIIVAAFLLVSRFSACGNGSTEPETNPTQVMMKLGGDDCEFYLGAVDAALKKLKGVQEVDLSTQKGHAIVKTDGSLKASQVVDAVDSLSGEGWSCEAELQD